MATSTDRSIWALFLRETFEGLGIGQALLRLAVEWLFRQSDGDVSLTTGVGMPTASMVREPRAEHTAA